MACEIGTREGCFPFANWNPSLGQTSQSSAPGQRRKIIFPDQARDRQATTQSTNLVGGVMVVRFESRRRKDGLRKALRASKRKQPDQSLFPRVNFTHRILSCDRKIRPGDESTAPDADALSDSLALEPRGYIRRHLYA
jgi:hypothetical protein